MFKEGDRVSAIIDQHDQEEDILYNGVVVGPKMDDNYWRIIIDGCKEVEVFHKKHLTKL